MNVFRTGGLAAILVSFIVSAAAGAQARRLLGDFETPRNVAAWDVNGSATRSTEHVTCGRHSLKAALRNTDWPGLSSERVGGDWSAFNVLVFDIFNPEERVYSLVIRIDDKQSTGYGSRYNEPFPLNPGANHFELPLSGLRTSDKRRVLDPAAIRGLHVFLAQPGRSVTLYVDNVALEKREERPDIPEFRFLDFGPDDSPVWPGATAVTPGTAYTRDRGFGFDRPGPNRRDRKHPDPLYGDWVEMSRVFRLDLPNGEYAVVLMDEDPGYWDWYPHTPHREIWINDRKVWEETVTGAEWLASRFFRHFNDEDLPGVDIWNRYVVPRYRLKRFDVRVTRGRLSIAMRPGERQQTVMSTLVVFPISHKAAGDAWLRDLDKRREQRFRSTYVESPVRKPPAQRPAAREGEVLVFTRPPEVRVYPYDYPRAGDLVKEVRLTCCRGERAVAKFSMLSFGKERRARVAASALVSAGGRIASDRIRLRWVQYRHKRRGAAAKTYEVRPELLRDATQGIPLRTGVVRTVWVDFTVPDKQTAGEYEGRVTIRDEAGRATLAEVRLTVEVLPVALDRPKGILLGMYYYPIQHYRWFEGTRGRYWPMVEAQLRDMREHGMTSVVAHVGHADMGEFVGAYRRCGFSEPLVFGASGDIVRRAAAGTRIGSEQFKKRYGQALGRLDREARGRGGDVIFTLLDEPTNVGGMGLRAAIAVAEAARAAGVRTMGALNHKGDEAIFPHLDYPCVNDGVGINARTFRAARRHGRPLFLYNCGKGRLSWGFYLYRMRVKGRFEFAYQVGQVDPYYDLDARESDIDASYPSPEGPVNVPWWETMAMGVSDLRYCLTLERLARERSELAGPRGRWAARAEALLRDLTADISPTLRENRARPVAWLRAKRQRIQGVMRELARIESGSR